MVALFFTQIQAQPYKHVSAVLDTNKTIIGETIHYPGGELAQIHSQTITIKPGENTIWHKHGVPLFAYILSGQLTVDYGDKGVRIYKAGDSFMEAMNHWHRGINPNTEDVRILAVYMGGNHQPRVIKKDK